jgi:hypothetical protein
VQTPSKPNLKPISRKRNTSPTVLTDQDKLTSAKPTKTKPKTPEEFTRKADTSKHHKTATPQKTATR